MPAVRVQGMDVVHVNDDARVVAFRRSAGSDELLIVASLNNQVFESYAVQTDAARLADGAWSELFNSDAAIYGGNNIGNFGATLYAANGRIEMRIPANGLLIFEQT